MPTRVESAWLVAGAEDDPDYLMQVSCETEDGIWRVRQRIIGQDTDVQEWPTEDEARAHLQRIYDYNGQHGRWRIRQH